MEQANRSIEPGRSAVTIERFDPPRSSSPSVGPKGGLTDLDEDHRVADLAPREDAHVAEQRHRERESLQAEHRKLADVLPEVVVRQHEPDDSPLRERRDERQRDLRRRRVRRERDDQLRVERPSAAARGGSGGGKIINFQQMLLNSGKFKLVIALRLKCIYIILTDKKSNETFEIRYNLLLTKELFGKFSLLFLTI